MEQSSSFSGFYWLYDQDGYGVFCSSFEKAQQAARDHCGVPGLEFTKSPYYAWDVDTWASNDFEYTILHITELDRDVFGNRVGGV